MKDEAETELRVVKITLSRLREDELKVIHWIDQLPRNNRGIIDLKRAVVSALCERIDHGNVDLLEPNRETIEVLEELKEELCAKPNGGKSPIERAAEMSF